MARNRLGPSGLSTSIRHHYNKTHFKFTSYYNKRAMLIQFIHVDSQRVERATGLETHTDKSTVTSCENNREEPFPLGESKFNAHVPKPGRCLHPRTPELREVAELLLRKREEKERKKNKLIITINYLNKLIFSRARREQDDVSR